MRLRLVSAALAVATLAACGTDKPVDPVVPTAPTAAPTVTPAVEPPATAAPEPSTSATADAAPTSKPKSGRVPILMSDTTEVSGTFGYSPSAKLEVGEKDMAIFRIPEDALRTATVVTFKVDSKGKSNGAPLGKIYHLTAVIPPAVSSTVTTAGPPFELTMPTSKKDANLAIGEVTQDNNGREKIKWSVIAPTKVDDSPVQAHFELQSISDQYMHMTTKAPAAAKDK